MLIFDEALLKERIRSAYEIKATSSNSKMYFLNTTICQFSL